MKLVSTYILLFVFCLCGNTSFSQFSRYGTKVYRQNHLYKYWPYNFGGRACEFKNKLFFYGQSYGRDVMFSVDGFTAPKPEFYIQNQGFSGHFPFYPFMTGLMAVIGDTMYYCGYSDVTKETGLWGFDGINNFLIKGAYVDGPNILHPINPYRLRAYKGKLYFFSGKDSYATLYEYDPGNDLLRMLTPNSDYLIDVFSDMEIFNDNIYFSSTDMTTYRGELHAYDLNANTVRKISNFATQNPDIHNMVLLKNKLYFVVCPKGYEHTNDYTWYEYDGLTAPKQVYNNSIDFIVPNRYFNNATVYNDELYFLQLNLKNTSNPNIITKYNPDSAKFITVYNIPGYGFSPPFFPIDKVDWFGHIKGHLFVSINNLLYRPDGDTFRMINYDIPPANVRGTQTVAFKDGIYISSDSGLFHYTDTVKTASIGYKTVAAEVKIYPNPATNTLNVDVTRPVQAVIYTTAGKLVSKRNVDANDKAIDISALPQGMYYLQLKGDNISSMAKFVKE